MSWVPNETRLRPQFESIQDDAASFGHVPAHFLGVFFQPIDP
jgi:hypothetical protein